MTAPHDAALPPPLSSARGGAHPLAALRAQLNEKLDEIEALHHRAMTQPLSPTTGLPRAVSTKTERRGEWLREHQFKDSPSVLTTMLNSSDKSFLSIYHLAVAMCVWLFVKLLLEDLRSGKAFDILLFKWSFHGALNHALPAWLLMQSLAFLAVPLVQLIASRPTWGTFKLSILFYAAIQLGIYSVAGYTCLSNQLPPATGFILSCEAARLSMKLHAYVREKVVHGLRALYPLTSSSSASSASASSASSSSPAAAASPKGNITALSPSAVSFLSAVERFANYLAPGAEKHGITVETVKSWQPKITIGGANEEIGRWLYFVLVPTLIYRDQYPLIPGPINWIAAASHAGNFLGVVAFAFLIIRGIIAPNLTPILPKSPIEIALVVESVMMPSLLLLVLGFYGLLHSWLNLWAEVFRFADRRFYSNWWSSGNWSSFYRDWNKAVGDFIASYLYSDTQRFGKSRAFAQTVVFVVSAIIHEAVLAFALRMWYPALMVLFGGPGVAFMSLTRGLAPRLGNVFLWINLSAGLGILIMLYSRELYARHGPSMADFVEPARQGQYPYVHDPALHGDPSWTWKDWLSYHLIPRSFVEFIRTYYRH